VLRSSCRSLPILFIAVLEIVLLTSDIPVCSDTANYLSHPGLDTLSLTTDSFLYYLLHVLGDNSLWFQLIQITSIVVFNLSVFALRLGSASSSVLAVSPFLLSIVGLHYWSCAIRAGLSFSFMMLAISLLEILSASHHGPVSTLALKGRNLPFFIAFIFTAVVSILIHWSAIFILLVLIPLSSRSFDESILLFFSLKIKAFSLFFLTFLFLLGVFSLHIFSAKINSYSWLASSAAVSYGTKFPLLVFWIFLVAILLFRPWVRRNSRLKSLRGIYILAFSAILSFAVLVGFASEAIRLLVSLQFVSAFYILLDSNSPSRSMLFCGLAGPPFIWYSLTSYSSYYFS